MSLTVGIRKVAYKTSNTTFTADTTLATVGLLSAIAAGQTLAFRAWIPITVGATGGVKALVSVPAGSALYNVSVKLFNTVAPSLTTAIYTTSTTFTDALANAGNHWLEIEGQIVNGATAGNIDIQMACNSAANALVVLRGAKMEMTVI